MSKIKTINLTGSETKVEFESPYSYIECNNLGNSDVLMSVKPNPQRGEDDVLIISSGTSASIGDVGASDIKEVYLSGSGEVQIVGKGYAQNSFKAAAKGGDPGGGGGGGSITVDSQLSKSSKNPVENRAVTQAMEDTLKESEDYTDEQIGNLINGSAAIVDTLEQIAQAMEDNKDVVEALDEAIGNKANKTDLEVHIRDYNNPHRVTKEDVGLDKVDNTPDAEKNVRSAEKLTNPVKIVINDDEKEFDGTKDIKFNIPTGGGTDATINGVKVEGNLTFEDLGWYALTSEKAADIVNKAFDNIAPYITVAEYPLTDTIEDGYGLTFNNIQTVDSHITNGGLSLDRNFSLTFSVDNYDPLTDDTIIISFDVKYPEGVGRTSSNFIESNGTIKWGISNLNDNQKYVISMFVKKSNSARYVSTGAIVNRDDNWYNISFKLSNYQRHCEIKYGDSEYISCTDIGIDDFSENIDNKSFVFNPSGVAYNISIKNLKVEISK